MLNIKLGLYPPDVEGFIVEVLSAENGGRRPYGLDLSEVVPLKIHK